MPNNREIAFLLGAGTTIDAGLPGAVRLTEIVEDDINQKFPQLTPVLRFIDGAIRFGRGCRGGDTKQGVNIEEFLIACSLLANRNESPIYPFVSAWHEKINEFQSLPVEFETDVEMKAFDFLANYCESGLQGWLAISDSAKLRYLWGIRRFLNEGYKLHIFTLNYDESIERIMSEIFGEVNTNWTTGFDQNGWNPNLLDNNDYSVYIYKLHGSLDWVQDERLGICSVKWPPARDSEELPEGFRPLLIFGTDAKLRPVDPFLTLLSKFQQALNNCHVLNIVGYSFGDQHINTMIMDALQRWPQMRCLVVNPDNLQQKLPASLSQYVAVERFEFLKVKAKQAFEDDLIFNSMSEIIKKQDQELPF